MRTIVFSAALLLGGLSPMLARWGTGGCAAVAAPSMAPLAPITHRWVRGQDPCQVHLFLDGHQAGTYRYDDGYYYEIIGDRWGHPRQPPIAPPPPPPGVSQIEQGPEGERVAENFGVDESRLSGRTRYSVNGVERTRQEVHGLLRGESLTDDSMLLRLTVIGTPQTRKRVLDDLLKEPLASLRSHLSVSDYAPDDWAVKESGFVTGGQPTIYVQAPGGKVLHRQDDYQDGAEGLYAALRKADPNYDPKKDPDLRKADTPINPPPPAPDQVPSWAWWAITGLASLLGLSWLPRVLAWAWPLLQRLRPAPPASDPQVVELLKKLLEQQAAKKEDSP